jgi:hypothetical protein
MMQYKCMLCCAVISYFRKPHKNRYIWLLVYVAIVLPSLNKNVLIIIIKALNRLQMEISMTCNSQEIANISESVPKEYISKRSIHVPLKMHSHLMFTV